MAKIDGRNQWTRFSRPVTERHVVKEIDLVESLRAQCRFIFLRVFCGRVVREVYRTKISLMYTRISLYPSCMSRREYTRCMVVAQLSAILYRQFMTLD